MHELDKSVKSELNMLSSALKGNSALSKTIAVWSFWKTTRERADSLKYRSYDVELDCEKQEIYILREHCDFINSSPYGKPW